MADSNDWVEVLEAPNQLEAEIAVELLTREGIPARIKPSDSLSFLGGFVSPMITRVLVPGERADEARGWLEPGPDSASEDPGP
jgi:Putative prokaryotic signal transducing protein